MKLIQAGPGISVHIHLFDFWKWTTIQSQWFSGQFGLPQQVPRYLPKLQLILNMKLKPNMLTDLIPEKESCHTMSKNCLHNIMSLWDSCVKKRTILFNTVDSKQMFNINFAYDWIRTVDLWYWKRPLYQLSHNHFQEWLVCLDSNWPPTNTAQPRVALHNNWPWIKTQMLPILFLVL